MKSSFGKVKNSHKLLDLLYIYYNKAYSQQTWQGGDLLWETTTHIVIQPFEHVVTWDHVIN